jgi:hypothetical protein
MSLIRQLDSDEGLSVMSVQQADLQGLWAQAPNAIRRWLTQVGSDAVRGVYPDLGVVPGFAVTSDTPADDFRWKILKKVRDYFEELGRLGLAVVGMPEGAAEGRVTAIQIIADGRAPHVRINGAVCGILWGWARPGRLDIGLELVAAEREDASHFTVFIGHDHGKPACFVFCNIDPSVIRAESPGGLVRKMGNSLGVPQARQRWARLRRQIDPEDVRSALFEAIQQGVHPDERGSFMLDVLEKLHYGGLPSRKSRTKIVDESGLRRAVSDEKGAILDLLPAFPGADFPVEEEVLATIGGPSNEALVSLSAAADDEELVLLRALEDGWRADPSKSFADIARDNGWRPQDAEAVRKRLMRKAAKIKKLS